MVRESKKSHEDSVTKEELRGVHLKEVEKVGSENVSGENETSNTEKKPTVTDKQDQGVDVGVKSVDNVSEKSPSEMTTEEIPKGTNKSKPNKVKRILAVSAVTIAVIGAGLGGAVLLMNKSSSVNLMDFNSGEDAQVGPSGDTLKLKFSIEELTQKVSNLENLPAEVEALKMKEENMNNKIENLRQTLEQEVKAFFERSQRRDEELLEIRRELDAEVRSGAADRDQLKKIGQRLETLHNERDKETQELEAKLTKLKALMDKEVTEEKSPAAATKKTVTPLQQTTSKENGEIVERVASLGHLKLEAVTPIGGHKIALLSDGISGAIQVSEGDNLGIYRIAKIGNDHLIAVHQNGARYRLEKGGDV